VSRTDTSRMNRRDFLKFSGASLSGLVLHRPGQALAAEPAPGDLAILYDASKCIGCRACERACKEHNDLPAPAEPNMELSPTAWNMIVTRSGVGLDDQPFFSYQCMHCTDAACAMGCPSGALSKDEHGFVSFDQAICIGCGYCTQFCPFGIPQLGQANLLTGEGKAAKCTFCQDKVAAGSGGPSCAEACPTGALTWGERGVLLAGAKTRVDTLKAEAYSGAQLYGEYEAGGLHRMSILLDAPSAYGLPTNPDRGFTAAHLYRKIIQPAGFAIFGAALAGIAIAFALARRNIHMEETE